MLRITDLSDMVIVGFVHSNSELLVTFYLDGLPIQICNIFKIALIIDVQTNNM